MNASATGPTGEVHGSLQNSREVEISLPERTGSSAAPGENGAASPESHRGARSRVGQRSVLEEQFPGSGGHQNRHSERAVGSMGSFSQELHQAVWDVLQNLARATPGKIQKGRSDWKRYYHDRSPPIKFSPRGETNADQQINKNMALVDLEDRSCSDRASVIDPTQELCADRPISSRRARILHNAEINLNEKLDREMEIKYRQLPTKNLWKIRPALPLQEDDDGRGFVELMISLDQSLQDILSLDPRSTSQALSWAPRWHVPLRKCLWDSVNPTSFRFCSLNAMMISCMEQVEGAMDAGSSGEEAYRLLVSELRSELDTRECGAALQKLIVFHVGEGVPFSDCYRSFRTVVHDAKSDGQFAANFNIVQSIVSVLMSQQYPTLYEISFPRNTPNRYFLDEVQM